MMSTVKSVAQALGTFILVIGSVAGLMYLNAMHWAGVM